MISVVIPCRNEEQRIRGCLESVQALEIPSGEAIEVLVVDGRSTDRTGAIVREIADRDKRITLIDNPGLTPPYAMNLGIEKASGDWIVRLDAHAEYPPNYLLRCYEIAQKTGAHNTGGICITRPGSQTYSGRLVQALMSHKFGVGNSGFRTGAPAGPRDTVPFGFFRESIFGRIGLFDERLSRTQDYEFNRRLTSMGGLIYLDPSIVSYYYSPKSLLQILGKFLRQQGPFVAYMWYLAPHAFSWRHLVPAAFVAGLVGGICSTVLWQGSWWWVGSIVLTYAVFAVVASVQQVIRYREPLHLVFLPLSFLAYHLSYGLGVITGLIKVLFGRSPVQKALEPWPGAGKYRVNTTKVFAPDDYEG